MGTSRAGWLRHRTVPFVVLALVLGVLTVLAVHYRGYSQADVRLNDGTVWVTKKSQLMIGRLGRDIGELTGGVHAGSQDYDIAQDADGVLVHDQAGSTIAPMNLAYVELGDPVAVPAGADVELGGSSVAVVDGRTGGLWVRRLDTVSGLDIKKQRPTVALGAGALAAVAGDGTVYGLDLGTGKVTAVAMTDAGTGTVTSTSTLEGAVPKAADGLDFAVVGDQPVLLDRAHGTLLSTGHAPVHLPGVNATSAARLQTSSAAADVAAVAVDGALLQVGLHDGHVTRQAVAGASGPIRPVVVGGCTHAAWSASASYVMRCVDGTHTSARIPQLDTSTDELVFRVNRSIVVLNDVPSGNSWLVQSNMKLIDNWSNVTPPDDQTKRDKNSSKQNQIETIASRTKKNRPPKATDDTLGARPGRSTILPVLINDTDPDGDILTIKDLTPVSTGTVKVVAQGTAVQIRLPAGAHGQVSFSYTVDDGRGGTATARVSVPIVPRGENRPPRQVRINKTTTVLGGRTSTYVLGTWIDPDGDDLVLQNATVGTGDLVKGEPSGKVTYVDAGVKPGPKRVALTVSDGTAVGRGELDVEVKSARSAPPVAVADHVVATVGQQVTVAPLKNDQSPDGSPLDLASVKRSPGLEIVPDYDTGTFTVKAQQPMTTYLEYQVAANGPSDTGIVRLDVLPARTTNSPPVAVRDQALLPQGGSALVDLTANDEDADNDVLVVQSISAPPGSGLRLGMIEQHLVKVTSDRPLDAPVEVTYTVTDGDASDQGTLIVTPVPRNPRNQAPLAAPDTITVRAGDIASAAVLANDKDPEGDPLTLDHALVERPRSGLVFVDGDRLRVQAPATPGTLRAVYKVRDPYGQTDSALVTIYVIPKNPRSNSAPQPQPIDARAISGSTVRIPVPLDGIDPDGDSVTLVGPASAPAKGYIAATGPGWIEYTSFANATGPDSFTYAVQDRLGASATSTVRIGIAPRAASDNPPVALPDDLLVRSGRTVQVDVLANDSDLDLDRLTIPPASVQTQTGAPARLDKATGRLLVDVPAGTSTALSTYTVEDGHGGSDTAVVTVKGSPTAPLLAPVVRDDQVPMSKVTGRRPGDQVAVPVLLNDEDPDGSLADLTLSAVGASRGVMTIQKRGVKVALKATPQVLPYAETDADGNVSYGFVNVPGTATATPVLDVRNLPVRVRSGKRITLDLGKYVVVRPGRRPSLTTSTQVSATNSDGGPLVVDKHTLAFTSARGYAGQAALTFEVTDGTGPDDPKGETALLTIPIIVVGDGDTAPRMSSGRLQVAPGEPARELDLAALATDPNQGDRLHFAAGNPGSGISASLSGSVLHVAAAVSTRKGTSARIPVHVTDSHGKSASSYVTVSVVSSSRPLARAGHFTLEAQQGRTVTVPVLRSSYNPFPGKPLTLTGATSDSGGRVRTSGSQVSVTPAKPFVGTMTVTYTLRDATGDPTRDVQGTISVAVGGVPQAPLAPRLVDYYSHTAVLSWAEPYNSGAPITGYKVVSDKGVSRTCPATTCTITGLTNGTEYRFKVAATNKWGTGSFGPLSAVARPDQVPDKPQPPTTQYGDHQVTVSWHPPTNQGSAINKYELLISPSTGSGSVTVSGSTTHYTWTGLTNGTAYTFAVRAYNKSPDPGAYSDPSRPEVPAGPPAQPAAPTAVPAGDTLGNKVALTWSAPDPNGAPISSYVIKVFKDGALAQTITTGDSGTSRVVDAQNKSSYSFTVAATNKAGTGSDSPRSAPVTPFGKPATIGGVNATATGSSGQVRLQYAAPDNNGKAIDHYEVSIGGGPAQSVGNTTAPTLNGLNNGQSYSFRVRACNDYCGDWSGPSNTVTPYGAPTAPAVSGNGSGQQVSFSWDARNSGNGNAVDKVQYSFNGGGWVTVGGATGSKSFTVGYSTSGTLRVQAHNAAGWGATGSATATSDPDPTPPTVTVSKGAPYYGGGICTDPSCAHVVVTLRNFAPNTTYQYSPRCDSSACQNNSFGSGGTQVYSSITTNGSGDGSSSKYVYGYPNTHVWAIVTQGNVRSNTLTW